MSITYGWEDVCFNLTGTGACYIEGPYAMNIFDPELFDTIELCPENNVLTDPTTFGKFAVETRYSKPK